MKLSKKESREFVPHPETDTPVRGVIVDVTPLKEMSSQYGTQEVFKIVIESEVENEDPSGGNEPIRFCVWSRPYTASLHEKANFRKDLKRILGRDLTAQEEDEFDTEDLIGVPVTMMVEHANTDKGTFANIALLTPYKGKEALKASGKYVRVKDREEKKGAGGTGTTGSYRRTPAPAEKDSGREDWQKVKVHVGKHAGVDLGDLEEEAVKKLIDGWLPGYRQNPKPKADDKRLAAALEHIEELLTAPAEEEMPY